MSVRRHEWTQAAIREAIQQLQRRGRSLAWARAPTKLVKSAQHHFGSWKAAIESAGIDYESVLLKTPRYSDEELLTWLRETARRNPAMTLRQLGRSPKATTLRTHFGTLQAAVAKAGLSNWPVTSGRRRWTKAAVIAALRDLYGRGLTANADFGLYAAARHLFGSLPAAAAEAGVELKLGRTWSRREVIAVLRRLDRRHGKISTALVAQAGCRSAVEKHFGGIKTACDALGLRGDHTDQAREHAAQDDRETMLDRLRDLGARLKRPVIALDMPRSMWATLLRHFDTLDSARAAAGIPNPPPRRKWDRDRALSELRREHRRGTRLTGLGLIDAGRKDLVHAIVFHIGGLPDARRLARIPEPKPLPRKKRAFYKEWDDDRVIDEISERAAAGDSLAPSRCPRPLVRAAQYYWGSWREAIDAAGFDYNSVVLSRAFDDGELLGILRQLAADRPTMTLTELNDQSIATSLHRHYGGPEIAARRAGLPEHWPVRVHYPRMTRKSVRAALRARVAKGKSIERGDVTAEQPRVAYAIGLIHPDWAEALIRIGLRRTKRRRRGRAP